MTRTHTASPVWTWRCDECGFETGDLARQQYGLPSPEVMRERGWFIAHSWGDLCPLCVEKRIRPNTTPSRPHPVRASDGSGS